MILEMEGCDTEGIYNWEFKIPDIQKRGDEVKRPKRKRIPVLIAVMLLIPTIGSATMNTISEFVTILKHNELTDYKDNENNFSYKYYDTSAYYTDFESFYENEKIDIELSYVPDEYILQSIKCFYNEIFIIIIEYIYNEYSIVISIMCDIKNSNSLDIINNKNYSNILLYYNNNFYNIECNNNILNEIVKSIELLGE